MIFDPAEHPFAETHRLLTGGVAPRPIAFVGSQDSEGNDNLSPFSFFNVFGVNPPVVCFSPAFSGKTGAPKDTFLNVKSTKECTISIVTHEMVHQASLASAPYEKGVDEFVKAGFTKRPSKIVAPSSVAESPFSMEAKLIHHIDFGGVPGSANMLICEIVMMHIDDAILNPQGGIDPHKIDQVARLGGPWYSRARDGLFALPQPTEPMAGIDALPKEILSSEVFTGSDLGLLAAVPEIPAVSNAQSKELHHAAKLALASGASDEAWAILSGTPKKF